MKTFIAAGILALTSSLSIAAPAPADLHPLTTVGTDFLYSFGRPMALGYSFHVNEPILVNAIGTSDFERTHWIMLWDAKGNTLFNDVINSSIGEYPGEATYSGGLKYVDFNIILPVGDYVIGGWNYGGLKNLPDGTFAYVPITRGSTPTSSLITITASGYGTSMNPDIFSRDGVGFASGWMTLSAVAVVPEPDTYVMLFAGLAMIAGMTRRRRQ